MSPKVSATYRIKLQIYSELEPGLPEGRGEPSGLNDQKPGAPSAPEPEISGTGAPKA